ncbi:MAG: hypothetical protein K6357_04295 [Elusimicrobiota bacterium]
MKSFIVELLFFSLSTVFFISFMAKINQNIISESNKSDFRMSVSDSISSGAAETELSTGSLKQSTGQQEKTGNSYFSPKTKRSPFLSPFDYQKIALIEEQKRIADEELKKLISKDKIYKIDDPTKKYRLQGIVGKYAIINGDMVEEGRTYKKELTIVKVYSNYVIVKYKNKNYKLVIK